MASRKSKRFQELKKNHWWIWLVVFIILSVAAGILVGITISMYGSGIVSEKLAAETMAVRYMAGFYEACTKEGTDPAAALDGLNRDYIITDEAHNVKYVSGNNTCVIEDIGPDEGVTFLDLSVLVKADEMYEDEKGRGVFYGDEYTSLNVVSVLRDVDRFIVADPDLSILYSEEDVSERDTKTLSIPLWLRVSIDGGEFVGKAYINIGVIDLIIIIVLSAGISLLVFVIFVLMVINLVSGIVRRRKTLKVFFTDAVTQGNNMMFYIYKGEEQLKKRNSFANRMAVVDLTFVCYHNFCVCHSVEEGERMLCRMYEIIRMNLDKHELCAHCGAGEFALLLRFTDDDELLRRVKSLISVLEKTEADHKFGFHAGICVIPPDSAERRRRTVDIETEYANAGIACRTLGHGDDSGVAFFDGRLVEEQKWIDTVAEHQEHALANEEFLVYYQPKYDPRTDSLRGAEALIRWQSPEFGLIPPGRFIPIFEENGFITEIDHYMLQHAARDQKMWLDKGLKCVPVSVNVSRAHFIESDLAEQIRDIVDAEGTPHNLIEIELTESAFFDDKKAMINTISKLKEYGFAVSMDDFGSGYSSLNSLKDMPLDVLKLDAEFFRGEADGERAETVISEAIRLAKSLNMRTVAEGVEIRDQVDFLAAQGCDMIQGYYYSKPLPKDEFEQRM